MAAVSFPELDELEGKIAVSQKAVQDVLDEARDSAGAYDMKRVKSIEGSSIEKVEWLQAKQTELADLRKQASKFTGLKALAEDLADTGESWGNHKGESGDDRGTKGRGHSIGSRTAKGIAGKAIGTKVSTELDDVGLKTLLSTSAGWAPQNLRDPGYVPFASAPIMVLDLFTVTPTSQAAIKYMEQTTRTNNAAERSEGGTYGEAAFALTERSATVQTIGVWIPVTDEELEDVEEVQNMLDTELPLMVRQRLDLQVLVGDGNTPNIFGVNNVSGIQTQARGTDPMFDALLKGAVKVRVTGRSNPDAVVFHPTNWQNLRLTRTSDGLYILGNPTGPAPDSVWGMRPVLSDNQTLNTAVVGDWGNWARLRVRRDIVVESTNAHDVFFINGKQAIRAGMRATTVWKRPAAFCTVTGLS